MQKTSIKKNCEKCGTRLKNVGKREKRILSLSGEIKFKRSYYQCPECGESYIPYDDFLGIGNSMLNKRSAKALSWLSIFMPFEHVKAYCKEIMSIDVSETCLKELTQRIGSQLHKEMEQKGKRPERIKGPDTLQKVLYIQADGSMVPIRGTKERDFKEVKVGLVYSSDDIIIRKTKKGEKSVDIKNKCFISSIGEGVEPFKQMLYAAAREKGYCTAETVVIISDGAPWISNMRHGFFPKAIHILDWYHAIDHLWKTAHVLFGETNTTACEQWVLPLKELLWNGGVNAVIEELERQAFSRKKHQSELLHLRGYYVSNRENMRYDEYRDKGYSIGSGAIESAHKYIVASRLKQAGMRWTLVHANAMIWLRCKYFEGAWNDFWTSMDLKEYLKPVQKKVA